MQPHVPPTHAVPLAFPAQSTHAEAEPHADAEVPDVQVPIVPSQQKPAPQAPPSQLAVHEPPMHVGVSPLHAWHAVPAEPHCIADLPGTQLVPLQHPPLHVRPPAHELPQWPVPGLQAWPAGQLPGVQGASGGVA